MKFNQEKLSLLLDNSFKEGQALERAITSVRKRVRYTRNPKQLEYAKAVLGILADGNNRPAQRVPTIGLIQAETGTGKTLGYTIPLLLYCATTGKRAVISTYTLQLIRQLNEVELPVAIQVVEEVTGKKLSFARRLGMQNFLSTKRIELLLSSPDFGSAHKKLQSMLNLVTKPENDGLIEEWLEQYGEFPEGVSPSMVCITSDVAEQEDKYQRHVETSKEADVLITTHATALVHLLTWFQILDNHEKRTSVICFDEADKLSGAAGALLRKKVQVRRCSQLIKTASEKSGANLDAAKKDVEQITKWFDEMSRRYIKDSMTAERHFVSNGLCAPSDQAMATKNAKRLQTALRLARRVTRNNNALRLEIEQEINGLDEYIRATKKQAEDHSDLSAPTLSWSPINRLAGFETTPIFPGRIIGRCWAKSTDRRKWKDAEIDAVIFTSATLSSDAWTGVNEKKLYADIRNEIGIYTSANKDNELRVVKVKPFVQSRFGRIEFVLADPRAPLPTLKAKTDKTKKSSSRSAVENEQPSVTTNPAWLDYVSHMVKAASKDGRTLVLCTSYKDTRAIGNAIPKARVHVPGESLDAVKNEYMKGDYSALVTPAGWEGLDLKGAIKNVVITRLPFEPPDMLHQDILVNFLIGRGMTEENALGYALKASRSTATRKFLQAVGRLIRDKNDSGIVWIGDPRFPVPEQWEEDPRLEGKWSKTWQHFVEVIPERFREGEKSSYSQSSVFVVTNARGKVLDIKQPEEVV